MTTPAKSTQGANSGDAQLEKVKLIAPHKHAGKKLQKDDEIEVNPVEKEFLLQHKKIAGTPQNAAAAAKE
ncbi:DUF7210 family protein [Pseudomonas nitroreducens]|uniref:DUF7210 domain-containing protein n=1 Tax=Pseudomonas nitroreducens TaxID=46680 RepID=A0A6G6IWL0_PSENT|nr:hypothetical protein [Pseudomonas nitroreducens]QIE87333.1 hypothetical protein G5B91_14070 [Pseudomonas nitroreducens]